jgi:hypothetical protein
MNITKRTYSHTFSFKCEGLVTLEEIQTHFYSGWPHFLQGFLLGVIVATERPWTIKIGFIKIRKIEYAGIEERGEVKLNVQTTVMIDSKTDEEIDGELKEKATEDAQSLMKVANESYQKIFLDFLPFEESEEEEEDAE